MGHFVLAGRFVVSHQWDISFLLFGKVELGGVGVERFLSFVAVTLEQSQHTLLHLRRDVIFAVAIAVVMRAAAEDVEEAVAYLATVAVAAGYQQSLHTARDALRFCRSKEAARVAFAGGGQHGHVLLEVGRRQECHGVT